MEFDQEDRLVFRVARDAAGQWTVTEDGFDKPLASFDEQKDAFQYAEDLAKTTNGSTVKVFGKTDHQMPGPGKVGRSH